MTRRYDDDEERKRFRTAAHPRPPMRIEPRTRAWPWIVGLGALLVAGAAIYGMTRTENQTAANPPAVLASPAPVSNTPPPAPQTTAGQSTQSGQSAPAR